MRIQVLKINIKYFHCARISQTQIILTNEYVVSEGVLSCIIRMISRKYPPKKKAFSFYFFFMEEVELFVCQMKSSVGFKPIFENEVLIKVINNGMLKELK